ncbi:MAG: S41 family peptidase [Phycisphaerae bacterium]|nr:S41 family peptidase [Phycisphaerae bacterium]
MPKRNIVWIIIAVTVAVLLWKGPESRIRRDALYNQFSPLLDVRLQIQKHYVEQVREDDLLHGAIDGMLSRLDPYSTFYTESEYAEFQKRTEGQFPGIGVHVGTHTDGGLLVVSPIEGSPAFRARIRSGDRITHIDGEETRGKSVEQCVKLISGEAGTRVTLTIERTGIREPFKITITRAIVNVPTVRGWARTEDWKWEYVIDQAAGIGYVRILSFEGHTDEQFRQIVDDLFSREQIRGLIIDVRDNPGGLLDVVVAIANYFIPEGVIVSTKSRLAPPKPYVATRDGTYPPIPLAILVNGGSASASEILAGALKDHQRAAVIGENTFGKGSVQTILQVENDNGWVKLTTAYYYLPNGERIHGKGVQPDRAVILTSDERAQLLDSWLSVYAAGDYPTTTQATTTPTTTTPAPSQPASAQATTAAAASAPATATAPAGERKPRRFEIIIDRQLRAAIDTIRTQLAEKS